MGGSANAVKCYHRDISARHTIVVKNCTMPCVYLSWDRGQKTIGNGDRCNKTNSDTIGRSVVLVLGQMVVAVSGSTNAHHPTPNPQIPPH